MTPISRGKVTIKIYDSNDRPQPPTNKIDDHLYTLPSHARQQVDTPKMDSSDKDDTYMNLPPPKAGMSERRSEPDVVDLSKHIYSLPRTN